jgi:MFS family permease
MSDGEAAARAVFTTNVPARLDRLPWSRFHWLVVTALGITWILDGLEVTIVGSLSGVLTDHEALGLTSSQIGFTGSAYVFGAVIGALIFGHLTDKIGRKPLFTITVGLYLVATICTGLAWNFWSFMFFRVLTGAGIGGEYSAVNSAIQELIPARRRGFTDLVINGSYWVGAAIGALGAIVVLDPAIFPVWLGWRLAFIIGGCLAVTIIYIRRFLPESPRWLMTHGRPEEAERIIDEIESQVANEHGLTLEPEDVDHIRLVKRHRTGLVAVARALFSHYPKRTALSVTLMATQAFCYNAIFFTYALILTQFYKIPAADIGWFMLPFAIGNFLGPLLLGHYFDTIGRKVMITATYALAGILLTITGYLFYAGVLSAVAQTAAWTVIFFFASTGASAAYLTVGESFPLETRAMAIAIFYSVGTAAGGISGTALFGVLIESGNRGDLLWGYLIGGGLMLLAAVVEMFLGLKAERVPLEELAPPLSRAD